MIIRRVVTGHDGGGKAVFKSDGPPPRSRKFSHTPGFAINVVWITEADSGDDDRTTIATTLHAAPGGTVILVITFPPDSVMQALDMAIAGQEHLTHIPGIADRFEPDAPGMHRTDTIDYAIVMSGEISLELDDGEIKQLSTHDVVVQQGTRHAWRNHSSAPATVAFCMIGQKVCV